MSKRVSPKEFREFGYLQEVNRRFLHPLGMALAVDVAEDGTETWDGIVDWREDAEGGFFGGEMDPDKAQRVQAEWEKRGSVRRELLGSDSEIEPLDHEWPKEVMGPDLTKWQKMVDGAVERVQRRRDGKR